MCEHWHAPAAASRVNACMYLGAAKTEDGWTFAHTWVFFDFASPIARRTACTTSARLPAVVLLPRRRAAWSCSTCKRGLLANADLWSILQLPECYHTETLKANSKHPELVTARCQSGLDPVLWFMMR